LLYSVNGFIGRFGCLVSGFGESIIRGEYASTGELSVIGEGDVRGYRGGESRGLLLGNADKRLDKLRLADTGWSLSVVDLDAVLGAGAGSASGVQGLRGKRFHRFGCGAVGCYGMLEDLNMGEDSPLRELSGEGYRILLRLSFNEWGSGIGGDLNNVVERVEGLAKAEVLVNEYFGSVYDLELGEFKVWRISDMGNGVPDGSPNGSQVRLHSSILGDVYEGGYGYNSGRVFQVLVGAHWGPILDKKFVIDALSSCEKCYPKNDYLGSDFDLFYTPLIVLNKLGLDIEKYEDRVR
jgi:hypothetical protein